MKEPYRTNTRLIFLLECCLSPETGPQLMQQLPNYLLRSHHRHHLEGHHGGFMEYCTKLDSLQYYIFHTELLPEMCKPKTVTQTHSSNFTLSSTNHHYLHHYTLHQRHLRGHSTDLITTMHQNHFSSDKHAIANLSTHKRTRAPNKKDCALSIAFHAPIAQKHTKDRPVEL